MAINYVVHDLADPAVARRVAMLQRGGARINLNGFRRSAQPILDVAGCRPRDLGRTQDGRLKARILSVAKARLAVGNWGRGFAPGEAIIARNLEMLYLAAAARRRFAPTAPLFYELLDIHRLMIGTGAPSRLLRGLERHLLGQCDGVIVSSPAFERDYLRRHYSKLPPVLLWENKAMPSLSGASVGDSGVGAVPAIGRPWRIGWFGAIRCRRSLLCLANLARKHPGLIEVDIRGRITEAMGADFQAIVDGAPGLHYHGPYRYPDDLAEIYGQIHFVWAIDFYEAGFNSSWLLPNRLYEGGYCQRVPIALAGVETGRWLAGQGLGFQISDDLESATESLLLGMTAARYEPALAASLGANQDLFRLTDDACGQMVGQLQRKT
jgi:succinoglycan biosynthesis protein ExoL